MRGRVLLVDDDDDIRDMVKEALSDEGYRVTVLKNARIDAIEDMVAQIRPDCVLLDGGAGDGYGESWETAAALAAGVPPVPVIMFTAHANAVTEAHTNASGRSKAAQFAAVLLKPFELSDLFAAVEQAVHTPQATEAT